jgi:NHS family xanthosine MFS transporter
MMMTNGIGAYSGSKLSGLIIDTYFVHDGTKDWHNIWLSFAVYSLVIAILFAVMFKHKHDPKAVENVSH